MKKQLLSVSFICTLLLAVGQVNYYDKDKNPIESGTCEIDGLGASVTIPSSVSSYERVLVVAIFAENWSKSTTYSSYVKTYDGNSLKPGTMDYWIQNPAGGSDFLSEGYGNPALDILAPCGDSNRKYATHTVSIRILGGTHTGWETESTAFGGSKTVKAYDYTVLAKYDDGFLMDFGGAATSLSSKDGTYTMGYPFPDDTQTYFQEYIADEPFKKGEYSYLKYYDAQDDKYNSIEVKIIAEKKSNASGWTIEKIKKDIMQNMIYSTNKSSMYRNGFDKSKVNWHRSLVSEKSWFHPGYVKKYGKSGDKGFDAQFIAMKDNPISWTEENGWHILSYDKIFYSAHLGGTKEKPYVMTKYKNGGGSTLQFYVKETDEYFLLAGVYKDLKKLTYEGLTENEEKFINETIAGLAIK